jgi:membrane associated rhomboid family serine protease
MSAAFFTQYPATTSIIAVTVLISLYGLFGDPDLLDRLTFSPYEWFRRRRWYTLLTGGLVHAHVPHLAFNMLTLYFFGPPVEHHLGPVRFPLLYVTCLVTSDIYTLIRRRNDRGYRTLGASGAVSAAVFSFIVFEPFSTIYLFYVLPIPALLFAAAYLGYCHYASRRQTGHINHDAHYWGAVSGLLLTAVLRPSAYADLAARIGGLLN